MRQSLTAALFIAMLALTIPAQAQLRSADTSMNNTARLYDAGQSGLSLNRFFSPEHFRMGHSFEMSTSSYGGGSSLAMYTNSMMWQFNSKLAARVDLSMAYSPMNNQMGASVTGSNNGQVFLRNAEVAYRPTDSIRMHFSVRQSPYGAWASPWGSNAYRSPYSSGSFRMDAGQSTDALFFNDRLN